ncbi:hypothetical protein, partial [Ideonella dechloratans]|uniref:hypothetical protein n=1 Tax=Ideonella dechloratans TaxID=36863 RepID=UPI001478581E
LAALGDVRGALDLLHREQALRGEINADNQAAILAQMRATYRTVRIPRDGGHDSTLMADSVPP